MKTILPNIKIKPQAELLIIGLLYYEFHSQISDNNTRNTNPNDSEPDNDIIPFALALLRAIIEFPSLQFSNPQSRTSFYKSAIKNIYLINKQYLLDPKNLLSKNEKEKINSAIRKFYRNTQRESLFSLPGYNATTYDRIGHWALTYAIATGIAAVLKLLIFQFTNGETEQGGNKNETLHVSSSSDDISLDDYLKGIYDLYNQEEGGLEAFSKGESIWQIFVDLEKLLPEFSTHRKHILTGYIALNFGLIKEDEYKPRTQSYTSFNNFLSSRVKGVVNLHRKKIPRSDKKFS